MFDISIISWVNRGLIWDTIQHLSKKKKDSGKHLPLIGQCLSVECDDLGVDFFILTASPLSLIGSPCQFTLCCIDIAIAELAIFINLWPHFCCLGQYCCPSWFCWVVCLYISPLHLTVCACHFSRNFPPRKLCFQETIAGKFWVRSSRVESCLSCLLLCSGAMTEPDTHGDCVMAWWFCLPQRVSLWPTSPLPCLFRSLPQHNAQSSPLPGCA